jgi:M6 family metalloprotease-like protein
MTSLRIFRWAAGLACTVLLACVMLQSAAAMEQPTPGMIERMKAEGTYPAAEAFAKRLGNNELKVALRGKALPASLAPQETADQIASQLGRSLDQQSAKAISTATAKELDWVQLDLNNDRTVDERDVLALGYPQPKSTARFPSLGTSRTFCLLLEFPEYPHYFTQESIQSILFGEGTDQCSFHSLKHYYELSSYGHLNVEGMAYGWHMASHPRNWYHPDDSQSYSFEGERQTQLVEEAILAYDAQGEDFSQYDGDGDGSVDYFLVVYTGPVGDWATFWWGYFGVGLPSDFHVDGVNFPAYSWQWERGYSFGQAPPEPAYWDPSVTVHETGHALGLPDYYDYDGNVGPGGGVGGLDMMDGWGDHGCFSKYVLGWLTPTVAFQTLNDFPLRESNLYGDAVIFMPGFDPVTPWDEYYIAQNRYPEGLDAGYPGNGLMIWHVDARVNAGGGFRYDNSWTDHKLLKLMEADGLEEIEQGYGANAGDYYVNGSELSPSSIPNSNRYDGNVSHAVCNDISSPDHTVTADFNAFTSAPPNVNFTAPASGSTVNGTIPVSINANDDGGVSKVQFIIDGQLVSEKTSAPYSYSWNTLVEFNGVVQLTARAWDAEGQSASATISVTVSNAGVTSLNDGFELGLANWRALDVVLEGRGQGTHWATRLSPPDPAPLGSQREAWVAPANPDEWFGALDYLRSERINATDFTKPIQVRFNYRGRNGAGLYRSIDNGATWVKLEDLPDTYEWREINRTYALQDQSVYFRFGYQGDVLQQGDGSDAGRGMNIDNFSVNEATSDVPTIHFTSPDNDSAISGTTTFRAETYDDGTITKVDFYVMGGLAFIDTEAPWEYERNTADDDNCANVEVSARAEDDTGLPSNLAVISVDFNNPHPYPVYEQVDGDPANWYFQNDGNQPQWRLTDRTANSRPYCLGWEVESGAVQTDNYEGAWFYGWPVEQGRQALDLAGDTVNDPILRFMYKAQYPSGESMSVYFFSTWFGWQHVADYSDNQTDWVEKTISLTPWLGQSGQLVFWVWPVSSTDGKGLWIDDIWWGNRGPQLASITPNPANAGVAITLNGSGFGAAQGVSYVTFEGAPLDAAAYTSWSDTAISLTLPTGISSGYLQVVANDQPSNRVRLKVGLDAPVIDGLDPAVAYRPAAPPALSFNAAADTQRLQLLVDGLPAGESVLAPYSDLSLPLAHLRNGVHTARLRAERGVDSVFSTLYQFTVYSLPGDLNCDGVVNLLDEAELRTRFGLSSGDAAYRSWLDPNADGVLNEVDLAYLAYHYGEQVSWTSLE